MAKSVVSKGSREASLSFGDAVRAYLLPQFRSCSERDLRLRGWSPMADDLHLTPGVLANFDYIIYGMTMRRA